jgi:diamine N-acetyltransferase
MNIIFKEVDRSNWEECTELCVKEEQNDFVAANWYSILQAKFESDCFPFCIYDDDIMVGFIMYDSDPDTKRLEMSRLMIDIKFQGKGYGKTAVLKLLNLVKEKYGHVKFYTSFEPNNKIAQKLYESVGFNKTGEIMWDEEVMMIQL